MDAGRTIYWTTFIAALIVAGVAWSYDYNAKQIYPVLPIFPLILAAGIWLTGWFFPLPIKASFLLGRLLAARLTMRLGEPVAVIRQQSLPYLAVLSVYS